MNKNLTTIAITGALIASFGLASANTERSLTLNTTIVIPDFTSTNFTMAFLASNNTLSYEWDATNSNFKPAVGQEERKITLTHAATPAADLKVKFTYQPQGAYASGIAPSAGTERYKPLFADPQYKSATGNDISLPLYPNYGADHIDLTSTNTVDVSIKLGVIDEFEETTSASRLSANRAATALQGITDPTDGIVLYARAEL